jgi:tetratricopeptide (TPR) repeat protein
VKRAVLGCLLLLIAAGALYGYTATRRERAYRLQVAQGEAALARDEAFAAIEAFSGAILVKPGSMLGYLRRGEAYRKHGELTEALKDLRHASLLDPKAPRPLELLGDVNHALQRYDRAAEQYERYVALDDRSPRLLYKLALSHYSAGQPNAAMDPLKKAIALAPRFAEAHYLLGLCLRDLRRPREAQRALERAVDDGPGLLQAHEELADVYNRAGRNRERLEQLEALLDLDPSPSRHVALGLAYAEEGHTDRAVAILGNAAERYPDYTHTYVALGRVWLGVAQVRGDRVSLGKALEALEQAAATEESSEALTLFGRALLMASDEPMAERILQQATERRPIDRLAFYYLAEAAERSGHPAVARRALLDYRALDGDDATSRRRRALHTRIGDLSMQVNDAAAAATWYGRALDPSAPDSALMLKLADAQWRAGEPAAARATLKPLIDREPDNRAARTLLRRIR